MNRIGIVGGGQLAQMLALAGIPLGFRFVFLDPAPDACAAPLGLHRCSAYDDLRNIERFAGEVELATYEFENIPETSIEFLANHVPVYPHAVSLAVSRDRLHEKNLFRKLDIPTPPYVAVDSLAELESAIRTIGFPSVLKTRTLGYDGKGQWVLKTPNDITESWSVLGGVPSILESYIPFDREVSCVAVRSCNGETAFYPVAENVHRKGILRVSWCRESDAISIQIQEYTRRILEHLDHVGVLAVEYFQVGTTLIANEMAPRVHNSGHWTIEVAQTSQFENHLRAIVGLPLGVTDAVGYGAMINCIGSMPKAEEVLRVPGAHLHIYGKAFRSGRKVGHITVCAEDPHTLESRVMHVLKIVDPELAKELFNR